MMDQAQAASRAFLTSSMRSSVVSSPMERQMRVSVTSRASLSFSSMDEYFAGYQVRALGHGTQNFTGTPPIR